MKPKTVKKLVRRTASGIAGLIRRAFLIAFLAVLFVLAWAWFSRHFYTPVDTAEVDVLYDLVASKQPPAEALTLSLGLDVNEALRAEIETSGVPSKDELPIALKRLIGAMGLERYAISLVYGDQLKPPAFITNVNNQLMTITVSRQVRLRREQFNLLVHELSHVSVWVMDPGTTLGEGSLTLEHTVDTSGFFRGQGVLTLNGVTDDVSMNGEGGYSTEKKVYGYLKPEQFGYLLARYCLEHGIPAHRVEPFLESAGRKYFEIGQEALKRSPPKNLRRGLPAKGLLWCPHCAERFTVDLSLNREHVQCPKCSFVIRRDNPLGPANRFLARVWDRTDAYLHERLDPVIDRLGALKDGAGRSRIEQV